MAARTTGRKTAGKGNTKKVTAAKKTTAAKKPTAAQSAKKTQSRAVKQYEEEEMQEPQMSKELSNELILIVTLVISLLLLLSNFNLCGSFGVVVSGVMFGLFGFLAYLIPFLLFFGVAFFLANRQQNEKYVAMLIEIIVLFIVLAGMIQLAFGDVGKEIKILDYYKFSSEQKTGGGLFGGLLCFLFVPAFGTVGSYVILVALEIICIMLLTGKALFALVSDYFKRTAKQKLAEKRQLGELTDDEYEQQEMELDLSTKAQSFLLKPAEEKPEPKEEKKRKNFFGGTTPTVPAGKDELWNESGQMQEVETPAKKETIPQQESLDADTEQLVFNGTYKPSKDTVETVNSIYEEEIRKKFDHVLREPEPNTPSGAKPKFEKLPEPRPIEPFEPSFSEQALSDRRRMESTAKEKTIFEQAPYGMGTTAGAATTAQSGDAQSTKAANKPSAEDIAKVANEAAAAEAEPVVEYHFPTVELLARPVARVKGNSEADMHATAEKLKSTLESFGVGVSITNVSRGPAVTRYELQPEQGVKVSRITNLADDIKLNLAAADVRIEAPIPGKAAVGIEVPNKENTAVLLRELIESPEFINHPSDIAFTVGKDIGGQSIVADIGKMPHLLIAGATGSGKSVCINTIIMSILYKAHPSEVKLIMVDPKVVELSVYNGIPHLLIPVVTDPKKASAALNWAVAEMTDRYQKFAELGVRDIKGYNERIKEVEKEGLTEEKYKKLPQIVIIVDELADLMMVAPGEVEDAICRLAQMARAAGLHLILATQRPSVNVITGLIKANVPSRIAFAVSSGIDSRTILDAVGAEKLLGKGDMLFFPSGYPKPVRIQGAFVSDKEVSSVVEFLKSQNAGQTVYNEEISNRIATTAATESTPGAAAGSESGKDEYFAEAGRFIIEKDKASIGMLQRVYKIGFNRAARIMDQLSEAGVVGPEEGTKPRKIMMSQEEFEQYLSENA